MSLAEDSITSDIRQHFKAEIGCKIFDAAVLGSIPKTPAAYRLKNSCRDVS